MLLQDPTATVQAAIQHMSLEIVDVLTDEEGGRFLILWREPNIVPELALLQET